MPQVFEFADVVSGAIAEAVEKVSGGKVKVAEEAVEAVLLGAVAPEWETLGWSTEEPPEPFGGEELLGGGRSFPSLVPLGFAVLALALVALAIPGFRALAYRRGWFV